MTETVIPTGALSILEVICLQQQTPSGHVFMMRIEGGSQPAINRCAIDIMKGKATFTIPCVIKQWRHEDLADAWVGDWCCMCGKAPGRHP